MGEPGSHSLSTEFAPTAIHKTPSLRSRRYSAWETPLPLGTKSTTTRPGLPTWRRSWGYAPLMREYSAMGWISAF